MEKVPWYRLCNTTLIYLALGIHRFVYLSCYICSVPRYHTYTLNWVRIICDGLATYFTWIAYYHTLFSRGEGVCVVKGSKIKRKLKSCYCIKLRTYRVNWFGELPENMNGVKTKLLWLVHAKFLFCFPNILITWLL